MSGRAEATGADSIPDPPSDAMVDLVRRIGLGDPTAEADLVHRFARALRFLLSRLTRDGALAEDLYQETFRRVIEKVRGGELREPERLAGFVCGMARNLFLSSARSGTRRGKWYGDPEETEVAPDPAPGQLASLLARERATAVRRVLGELRNDRDREILSRYYITGDEKEEIRRDFGLSDLHFNRVLFRARQRYKELFERRHAAGREAG
ncbi:MAG TPA: RNA polymerase sigma factor [Thermoanaerobaculia bacterium]|jgi:RNA polymerase sigma-70 factor (ECF subfamily)|nr:RNA polymerase sigma factor [Thermoanaerobaculia bacterium]